MDVLHAAIDVTDLEQTTGFYEGLLGLRNTRDAEVDGVYNYWVGGEGPAELQFRVVDDKDAPAGIHHVAVATDDLDDVVDRAVSEWDSSVEMEPTAIDDSTRVAFVTDPEGYTVELVEDADR